MINNLPCPRMFAEERPCDEMTHDGLLGPRCASALRHALKEMPALWADLQVTLTRQAKTEDGVRGWEEMLPFSFDASWSADAVVMTVTTWIRDLAELHGENLEKRQRVCTCRPYRACRFDTVEVTWAPGRTMTEWCGWLTRRMHHIRAHPKVDQLWDQLTECARVLKRSVDRPAEQIYLCACAICGHPVFGPEHQDEVECRECRRVVGDGYVPAYSRAEETRRRKDALRAVNVPAHSIRTVVHAIDGIWVNRKTVHSWITRGKLTPVEWEGDVPLYSVAEAVRRAADIPLAARDVEDVDVNGEEPDHAGAYVKVLRVIAATKEVA